MRMSDFATGLRHIGIPTRDMTESLIFYTELGFDVVHTAQDPETGRLVNLLKLGDLLLEIREDDNACAEKGAIDHFAIDVNDIDGAYDFVCSRDLNTLNDEIHDSQVPGYEMKYFTIQGPDKELIRFAYLPQQARF